MEDRQFGFGTGRAMHATFFVISPQPATVFSGIHTGCLRHARLERRKAWWNRGTSLNQTVIDALRQSLGVGGKRSNGLARLAGTWTEAEHRRFPGEIQVFEKCGDEPLLP